MPDSPPRRTFSTYNEKQIVAIAAKCRGIIDAYDISATVPDFTNGRKVLYTLSYSDDVVQQAINEYPRFNMSVLDHESASQLVKSHRIAALRRAEDDFLGPAAAELVRQGVSPGIATRRIEQRAAEKREMEFLLNRVRRAQQRGVQRDDHDDESEGS